MGEDLLCYSSEIELTDQQRVFKRYHTKKHFWEKGGGENQLA